MLVQEIRITNPSVRDLLRLILMGADPLICFFILFLGRAFGSQIAKKRVGWRIKR